VSDLNTLGTLITRPETWRQLPEAEAQRLILLGAIASLGRSDDREADGVLKVASRECPDENIRALALEILVERALQRHNEAATTALFELAVHDNNQEAVAAIRAHGLKSPVETLQVLFNFLYADLDLYFESDSAGLLLTGAFLTTTDEGLRLRLLQAARRHGWLEWVEIVEALQEPVSENLEALVRRYARFTHLRERGIILHFLQELAEQGSEAAQEALCSLFLEYEDAQALKIVRRHGYLPSDPARRALYYFLTQQWERYEQLDADYRLLSLAYEHATPLIRRRLLNLSRYTGRVGWLGEVRRGQAVRGIRDLSDADWQSLIEYLTRSERWGDLWRIAQLAPPYWGVQILHHLQEVHWQPDDADESEAFQTLSNLAEACRMTPPQIQHLATYQIPAGAELLSFAVTPEGGFLAGGAADATVWLWNLDYPQESPRRIGGALGQPRLLAFSPDGQYLAGAFSDHGIRVFRLVDGALVKTLSGHRGLVRAMLFHPDGRVLFSAGFDGTIRVWRFPFGPELRAIHSGNGEEIFDLGLTEDGERLVSAGSEGIIRVWRWTDGALVGELPDLGQSVTALAVSSGQLVASYSRDGFLRVWNMVSGRRLWETQCEGMRLTALAFHPGEQMLFGSDYEGAITAWSLFSGKVLSRLTAPVAPGVGIWIHPKGQRLFSAHANGAIHIWNLDALVLARSIPTLPAAPQIALLEQKWVKSTTDVPTIKVWLRYLLELYRWLARYDVEITEPVILEAGEFDIQL